MRGNGNESSTETESVYCSSMSISMDESKCLSYHQQAKKMLCQLNFNESIQSFANFFFCTEVRYLQT